MKTWRRTVAASWVAQFLCIVGFSVSVPFLPFYVQTLGITRLHEVELWAGLLNAGGAISMAIVSPLWGALSDRRGRRMMVERAAFGGAVSIALMALTTNVHQLLLLRILQGSLTGTIAAFITLVVAVSPPDRVAQNLGLMQVAVYVGSSLGPLAGGFVAHAVGYRSAFLVTSLMLLTAGLVVHFLVDDAPVTPMPDQRTEAGIVPALRSLWHSPPLIVALLVLFCAHIASSNVQPILPLIVQSLGSPRKSAVSQTGIVIGAAACASSISAVFIGRVAGRIGERMALFVCALGAGMAFVPQMLARSLSALIAGQFAGGLFVGGTLPLANAVIARLTPRHQQGATYGLCTSLQSAARAIGPLMGSAVAMSLGMTTVFGVTGLVYLLVAVGVYAAIHPRQRSAAAAETPAATLSSPEPRN